MCSLVVVPIESTKMSEAESPKAGSSKAGSSNAGSSKADSSKAGSSKAGSSNKYGSFADESVVREIQYMDSIPEVEHHYQMHFYT